MGRIHREFLLVYASVATLSFAVIFIAASYFNVASIAELISFQSWEPPGPMPIDVFPKPIGFHFFGDFTLTFREASNPSPYLADGFMEFAYLPFSALVLSPLFFFSHWTAFLIFVSISVSALIYSSWRLLTPMSGGSRSILIIVAVMISGPMISTLDRGNVSLFLTGLCIMGLLKLKKGDQYGSALMFGLAGAMKLYPILFLGIFLHRRALRPVSYGVSAFVAATILPLFFFDGGFLKNSRELLHQFIGASNQDHALSIQAYNNSFFALFCSIRELNVPLLSEISDLIIGNYLFFVTLLAVIFVLVSAKSAQEWQILLLACGLMTGGPTVSGYYVYLLYLVPLFAVFSSIQSTNVTVWERASVWMIAVIFVPKGFSILNPFDNWSANSSTYSSLVNPLISLTLFTGTCIQSLAGATHRWMNRLKRF